MDAPLLDGSPHARAAAIAALARREAPPSNAELDALTLCLAERSKLVQRRTAEAFAVLAARGIDVGRWLHPALAAVDMHRRWGAVYALSLVGPLPVAAVPTLVEIIGTPDGDLRWAAADLLKGIAARQRAAVVAALIDAACVPGPRRKMALYCLRDLDVGEAVDVADAALADPATDVRLAALAAVAALDPDRPRVAARIAALVDDADPRMQRAAAGTLGGLGVRSAPVLDALSRAEASDDPSLRRAAIQSKLRLAEEA
jgi:HEAT repeat protein